MSSSTGGITNENIPNLQLPPLRSLDDFALGSARFQLPNLKDLDKWGNRVVKNLLYYQTNYFLTFIGVYCVMLLFHPAKIMCGLFVQTVLLAIFLNFICLKPSKITFIISRISPNAQTNHQHKWYILSGSIIFGFLLLYWFDAVLLATFTLLLPFSLTFIHASLRLRNIKNKVVNTMESFGPSTPMGLLLDAFNITTESILN